MSAMRRVAMGLGGISGLALAGLIGLSVRFYLGRRRAEQVHAARQVTRLSDPGVVEHLSVLPLFDWYTARADLAGGAGVAYLLRADATTILFDLGLNQAVEHPSPLLRNMAALGVDLAGVDAVFISHLHLDHTGGSLRRRRRSAFPELALSGEPVDFRGIPAYVPGPAACPTARVVVLDGPERIANGIAAMGPILRQDFVMGPMWEQPLAINVRGKGLVVVVGCGHPTLQKIVRRAEALFDAPLYGVIGGLHYPVTGSRVPLAGLPLQQLAGTGKPPWDPVDRSDVQENIAFLQGRHPGLVALSPHDTCDWSLAAFKDAFGDAYRDLRVGDEIVVS